ncbi:hypothetical protein E2C01_004384 [Portunus trituberculatus]|uniref:Uncharacterized protein n=1 Tax=Portunus trituberculatus TaxID=210409 RepID=A0A5B7CPU3_PORTR|nr:hypothetical protein [Portunus trituberculatus]
MFQCGAGWSCNMLGVWEDGDLGMGGGEALREPQETPAMYGIAGAHFIAGEYSNVVLVLLLNGQ